MAGWTITSWAAGADWTDKDIIQEFEAAYSERRQALGQAAYATRSPAGTDVQAASFWTTFQDWIETNCTSFVVAYVTGTKQSTGYYDNQATISKYASFAAFMTAACGAGRTDWRRYTTHPDDAGADLGGQMQAGDIMGYWIWEDLMKAFNALCWTEKTYADITLENPAAFPFLNGERGYGSNTGWSNAKDDAEADASVDQNTSIVRVSTRGREALPSTPGDYEAEIRDNEIEMEVGTIPTFTNHTTGFYVKAVVADSGGATQFDDYADNVYEDKWGMVAESSANNNATDTSPIFGRKDLAADLTGATESWCAEPTNTGAEWDERGWEVLDDGADDVHAVIHWNIATGFTYYES